MFTTLVIGCNGSLDTGYSLDLIYPLRKDPLVLAPLPPDESVHPYPPGKLDESIRKIPEKKGKILDPLEVSEAYRVELKSALDEAFGKPAEPRVKLVGKLDPDDDELAELVEEVPGALKLLKLDNAEHLTAGGKLFRRHCMHCHGLAGDGRGPSGAWLAPTPRDFRQGVFKFISSDPTMNHRRPRREDLKRTLIHGVEGTSMPSFALLSEAELDQLITYVIHLSLRGETEYDTLKTLLDRNLGPDSLSGKTIASHIAGRLTIYLYQWSASTQRTSAKPGQEAKSTDPNDPDFVTSVRRGYSVFTGQNAGCISCHQDFGRQARFRFDDWGTLVRPNNLTTGTYRGGRRPIDFYYRLRCGIPGSNMPKLDTQNFPDEDVWALINFLRVLPHADQLPEDVRIKVYGPAVPVSASAQKTGGGHE